MAPCPKSLRSQSFPTATCPGATGAQGWDWGQGSSSPVLPQQAEGPEAGRGLEHEGRGPLGTEGATNPQPMGGSYCPTE